MPLEDKKECWKQVVRRFGFKRTSYGCYVGKNIPRARRFTNENFEWLIGMDDLYSED